MSGRRNAEPRNPDRVRGYVLIVMLVVLITGSLAALLNDLNRAGSKYQQSDDTRQALNLARDALLAYATLYPDYHSDESFGFLPCPDTDGDGDADPAGSCQGNTGETVIGLLPYKTLGLPQLRDSNGNCLWYAVSGRFKASATNKFMPLNWDTQGQIALRDISDTRDMLKPEDAQGGAAAVVIAPGAPVGAQVRPAADNSKACSIALDAATYARFIESGVFPAAEGTTVTLRTGSRDHAAYNDELLALTPLELFTAIKQRKGVEGNDLVARTRVLTEAIANALTPNETLPDISSPTGTGRLNHGTLPNLTLSSTAAIDFRHWRNQYRYVTCSYNSKCIDTSGDACSGMLLLGGERTARGPRTGAETTALATYFEPPNLQPLSDDTVSNPIFTSAYGTNGLSSAGVMNTRRSLFAITDALLAASKDEAICLQPKPVNISGFDKFTSTQSSPTRPAVTINTATQTLTLGYANSSSTALYGCSWYGNRLPFGPGLRVYFRFRIDDRGAGFTLALADGSSNGTCLKADNSVDPACGTETVSRAPLMCGEPGASHGYSGNNMVTAPIQSPKLAVEFDTIGNTTSRNDPGANHVAFVYWAGLSRDDDVDNKHGVCATDVVPPAPCNPAVAPGISSMPLIDSAHTGPSGTPTLTHVRLDIIPVTPATTPPSYTLNAYITDGNSCSLDNLAGDVAPTCAPTLSDVLQTDMASAYLGFTVGQSTGTSGPQSITIDRFAAKGR